jgi:hypothetical protein
MDRSVVLERMDAARAELLMTITGLDESTMTTLPVVGTWTIRAVFAHLAGWAVWHLESIQKALAGEQPDFSPLQERDAFNARLVEGRSSWTMTEILDELEATRMALEQLLNGMPEEEIFQVGYLSGPQWENVAGWLRVVREHEEEHATQIRAWRTAVTMI